MGRKLRLTPKQQRFCEEYPLDFCATRAAIRAGYSEKTAMSIGSRLLRNVKVQEFLRQQADETSSRLEIEREAVLRELAAIAFSDITSVVRWGKIQVKCHDGASSTVKYDIDLIPSEDLSRDAARAISEVRRTRDGVTVKLHSKLAALETLAKHLGLFNQPDEEEPPRKIEIHWGLPRELKPPTPSRTEEEGEA